MYIFTLKTLNHNRMYATVGPDFQAFVNTILLFFSSSKIEII